MKWLRAIRREPLKALTVISILVGIAVGGFALADHLKDDPTPRPHVAFVLDTSKAMREPFGDTTKFAAAKEAIRRAVERSPSVSFSLRLAGGQCHEGYRDPDVDFATKAAAAFEQQLAAVDLGGRSAFADEVAYASDDLATPDEETSTEQVLVFIGAPQDHCVPGDPAQDVVNSLGLSGVDAAFTFFALLTEEEGEEFEQFAKALKEADVPTSVRTPEDEDELQQGVNQEVSSSGGGEGTTTTGGGGDGGDGGESGTSPLP